MEMIICTSLRFPSLSCFFLAPMDSPSHGRARGAHSSQWGKVRSNGPVLIKTVPHHCDASASFVCGSWYHIPKTYVYLMAFILWCKQQEAVEAHDTYQFFANGFKSYIIQAEMFWAWIIGLPLYNFPCFFFFFSIPDAFADPNTKNSPWTKERHSSDPSLIHLSALWAMSMTFLCLTEH